MSTRIGPCTAWIEAQQIGNCGSCSKSVLDNADNVITDAAIDAASEVLYAKSGRAFRGVCTATVRPCCSSSMCDSVALGASGRYLSRWADDSAWAGMWPTIVDGRWYNLSGLNDPCLSFECGATVPRLDLGVGPVVEIVDVTIDGEVLDPAAYRIESGRYLVRLDGDLWPPNNDLSIESGLGAWSVTFKYGWPPPALGVQAAAELACNLLLAFTGSEDCALPKRVVSVSRTGVTFNLADITHIIEKGGIGLYLCDLFVSTYNPNGLQRAPRVVNIDRPATPRIR